MSNTEEIYKHKIYRSATFEGMADINGIPNDKYLNMYRELAENDVKNIITGCAYVSRDGMMVQPGQAGIDSVDKNESFRQITNCVHQYNAKIYLQISHSGRQTSSSVTGEAVVGASKQKSLYFKSNPQKLSLEQIKSIINAYSEAAYKAKLAGFDGVQVHAAHGYLVHQFLHPFINNRTDEYGISKATGIGDRFLCEIIESIRQKCGNDYPILIKVSASDDLLKPFTQRNFISLITVLNEQRVEAIEISYGTMEDALNIFRGESIPIELIFKHNFRYKKLSAFSRRLWKLLIMPYMKKRFIKFSNNYNLPYAELAKQYTEIPIICVGGFRTGNEINEAIKENKTDYVSLCRPFLCEPDLIGKLSKDSSYISKCENCNMCAIMCDSPYPTRCYKR